MRNVIVAVIVILAVAAALWYTPQGRSLLHKFGVANGALAPTASIC